MSHGLKISLLSVAVGLLIMLGCSHALKKHFEGRPKVYVMMGFHTSFYHSWRGDTDDEAGFGTDIRVVRGILKILEDAGENGLDARGYWDIDGYFTLEKIIREYAPDIIDGIKKRVEEGKDEVLPAPYNNGMISAHTPDEMCPAVAWTMQNPWGGGLRGVFGKYTPVFRPQESLTTTGMFPILRREGIEAIILPYSSSPFTSIVNFVEPLPVEMRYGSFWLKHPTGEKMLMIPSYNQADALDYGSFELWLRNLRKKQLSGEVESDLLLHYNMDADAEIWLPMNLPLGLDKLPNTGGLPEIIKAVNKYPWAEFTTPGEYLRSHSPRGEVLVRRDTADGSFDGYYSWAEKFQAHRVWTKIEQSRMYSYRANSLLAESDFPGEAELEKRLWGERDSSFWYRLLAMSTTHFGMSTPILNEQRQAKADEISARARKLAADAYEEAAEAAELAQGKKGGNEDADYVITVFNYARSRDGKAEPVRAAVRLPVVLEKPGVPVVTDAQGNAVNASFIDIEGLGDGTLAGEVTFTARMAPDERRTYRVKIDTSRSPSCGARRNLKNDFIRLSLSEENGVREFEYNGAIIGAGDFIEPFITYKTGDKPKTYKVSDWVFVPLEGEHHDGLDRARLKARVPFDTPEGRYAAEFTYTFNLYDNLPYLMVDVTAQYPYTPPRDLIRTLQQKLRRLLDLRWVEVGPFQIHPRIHAPAADPLTVWKHNYLGVTSCYKLDYGRINPKNKEIDSFNHQVTNGWVAVENGKKGLLIAQDASVNAVFAFAPMRLRVKGKKEMQHLSVNPFGTYFGDQLDYSHTGSNQTGAMMTEAVGAHLRPSGPGWNGETEKFRLMLAPYGGGRPPGNMADDAMAFFYPCGLLYERNPVSDDIYTAEGMQSYIDEKLREKLMADASPLPVPRGVLANPTDGGVMMVWDAPRDERITGYHVRYEAKGESGPVGFTMLQASGDRLQIDGLQNGKAYVFYVRAVSGDRKGGWSEGVEGVPGKVSDVDYGDAARDIPLKLILKLARGISKHLIFVH